MRTVASVILIFLTIPLFVIGIFAAAFKFELLEPRFWENSFEKNNTYTSLTTIVKQSIISQTVKEGGRPSEITAITDIITTANVKDFVNKNLENILNYANGKVPQLSVYIPVSKLPKGLLPSQFTKFAETMPLTTLLQKLDIKGISQAQIQYISLLGRGSIYLLILDSALFVLFLILLFILTPAGARFIGPGIALIFDGLAALGIYSAGNSFLASIIRSFAGTADTAQLILGNVLPPLSKPILNVFLIAGITMLACGAVFIFIRKGRNLAASD